MDFDKESYQQEKLERQAFAGMHISGKRFEECEFNACTFIGCTFEECRFLDCKFEGCDLSNLVPLKCELREVSFSGCKTIGIDWTKAQVVKELSFSECLLNYSNFKMMKLPGTKMVRCEVRDAAFIETNLSKSDLRNSDFENSMFFKANLTGADFRQATNYFIDINNNKLKGTRFSLPEALSLLSHLDIIVE
jgi:uncharacterized protein YjbI with pentapeptide repeats